MKPLKLRTRHMPTKVTKPPKKGKGAKYDRKQQKKITESPDYVQSKSAGSTWGWNTGDNHAFGYFDGKFYIGRRSRTHYEMMSDENEKRLNKGKPELKSPHGSWRTALALPGRIWIDKGKFSLWKYPTSTSEWKKLVSDLSRTTGKNIMKFDVEVLKSGGNTSPRRGEKFVPVATMISGASKPKIKQRSVDSQNVTHLKSPMVKGTANVAQGWGSKWRPAGLSASQYHQKIRTSDGVIKLGPILEVILKVRRVKILLEQLLKEQTLGGWRLRFVIGPDSKFIPIVGGENHGSSLVKYPAMYKEALNKWGKKELDYMIEAGGSALYKFMYDKGFIRGGKYWLAFDPRKVSSKSLMVVLQLAKESNVKKFEIDANGKYNEVSIDEFIEKYM